MANRKLICFDVNETLLDFRATNAAFAPLGGDPARRLWFNQVLTSAMALSAAGQYRRFSEIGRQALRTSAVRYGWSLDEARESAVFEAIAQLPPHADAVAALTRLYALDYRLAALTNSDAAAVTAQLEQAGLAQHFEAILSVDAVQRYKPAPDPYRMAAKHFNVNTSEMWLVAVHDWDVLGAMSAGCAGAFVARDGDVFPETWPAPTVQAGSLADVAEAIAKADGKV